MFALPINRSVINKIGSIAVVGDGPRRKCFVRKVVKRKGRHTIDRMAR